MFCWREKNLWISRPPFLKWAIGVAEHWPGRSTTNRIEVEWAYVLTWAPHGVFCTTVVYRWLKGPRGREVKRCFCKILVQVFCRLVEIICACCGCWPCVFMVPLGVSFAMKLSEKIAESLKFLSHYTGDEWTGVKRREPYLNHADRFTYHRNYAFCPTCAIWQPETQYSRFMWYTAEHHKIKIRGGSALPSRFHTVTKCKEWKRRLSKANGD